MNSEIDHTLEKAIQEWPTRRQSIVLGSSGRGTGTNGFLYTHMTASSSMSVPAIEV